MSNAESIGRIIGQDSAKRVSNDTPETKPSIETKHRKVSPALAKIFKDYERVETKGEGGDITVIYIPRKKADEQKQRDPLPLPIAQESVAATPNENRRSLLQAIIEYFVRTLPAN